MAASPSPWMLDILRFALKATASTPPPWDSESASRVISAIGADDPLTDPKDPGNDPRFRKLVEAILFGRRFLKTYNLVLLGVLLVFTAWHWGEKCLLHQRARRDATAGNTETEEAWSSSSSTIEGSATPPEVIAQKKLDDADETSPLFSTKRPQRKFMGVSKPYYLLKSFLQYQPRPIPIVNKTLPTNAVSLFVLAYFGLTTFYNFYRMPMEIMYLFVFSDRCGIIIISNLPLLYLLAAKNQPIKFLTGYSYESLNIFHRRVGEVMCFQALLHFLGMLSFWYGVLRRLGFTLINFFLNRVVLLGLLAFICYEVIFFTSLGSFRQRWYEIFLATHIILQFGGLVFLFFHHHTSRPYVLISLAIFLIDRLAFRLWLKSSSHPVTLTVLDDDETVLLSSNWDISKPISALRPQNMKYGWQPNDHIFITIPALSHKHALQAHPFTIFSAAPTMAINEEGKHAWFTLLVRAQSEAGFTNQLLVYARSHPQARMRLDGPYGSSHALDVLSSSSTTIIIAGGSGIAVAYPILYSLLQPPLGDPEIGTLKTSRKVKLLWITHSPSHRLWIPEDKLKELEDWGLAVLIPPPTVLAGRPDVKNIIEGWVECESGQAGIVVSGPDGLVRDVRNTCASLIRRGENVKVQVEKFGW